MTNKSSTILFQMNRGMANDPFCKNCLPINILKGINRALLDNKGNKNLIFDESKIINEFSKLRNIELDTKEKFGLSRLSFKNMIYMIH